MVESNAPVEGICARNEEIKQLREFIQGRIQSKKSGIVYMPGGPGTGKSMCVKHVMDQIKSIPSLYINCAKVFRSRDILSTICDVYKIGQISKRTSELDMIDKLTQFFTAKKTGSHLMIMDEIDELPKSKAQDLFKKIFGWAEEKDSKLILIAIANTTDLTSRRDIMNNILGKDCSHMTRIIFRPYTSEDLKTILQWYVDNDPYLEGREIDTMAITLLARKFSRFRGDIRGAVNALKSSVEDVIMSEEKENTPEPQLDDSIYPTPPSTPTPKTPTTRRLTRATCPSVSKSISKRTAKKTLHKSDEMPYVHQVTLTCIQQLCSKARSDNISINTCIQLVHPVLEKSCLSTSRHEIRAIFENLAAQGIIGMKKTLNQMKISLRISDGEFQDIVSDREKIVSLIKALPK